MKSGAADSCRVLELGCGDGREISFRSLPMAAERIRRPGLERTGRCQRQRVHRPAGLKNIVLRAYDIMDVSTQFGAFDYISAHGVYSWCQTRCARRSSLFSTTRLSRAASAISATIVIRVAFPAISRAKMMRYHVRAIGGPATARATGSCRADVDGRG